MHKVIQKVETDNAPKAIGPYSQAVVAGPFLFISGQLPIEPKSGEILVKSIEDQTEQVISNIEAILNSKGLTLENVVKMEVFLKDLRDFQGMNAVYAKRLSHSVKPARHAFEVAKLPMDARVEISCTAFDGGHSCQTKTSGSNTAGT